MLRLGIIDSIGPCVSRLAGNQIEGARVDLRRSGFSRAYLWYQRWICRSVGLMISAWWH